MSNFLNVSALWNRRAREDAERSASQPELQAGSTSGNWTPPATINVDDSRCSICQEEYNKGSPPEIPLTLPCGHAFGSVCIAQWLHVRNRDHGCPICRNMPFDRREETHEGLEEGGTVHEEDDDESDIETNDDLPGFSADRATWEYLAIDGPARLEQMGDEMAIVMRGILGHHPSTEFIIDTIRTGDTRGSDITVEDMFDDHARPNQIPVHLRIFHRQETAQQYALIKMKIERAATWLRQRLTDYVLRELLARLEVSLKAQAQVFRNHDKETLAILIRAGLFHSRRMDASFSLRVTLSRIVPGEIRQFENTGQPAGPFLYRVVEAMPRLTAAYRSILDAQVNEPLSINDEINFMELWDADMAIEPLAQWQPLPRDYNPIFGFPPRPTQQQDPQPMESPPQPPAQYPMWTGRATFFRDNGARLSRTGAMATASASEDMAGPVGTSNQPSDPTPSSVQQQLHRVEEAADALGQATRRNLDLANNTHPSSMAGSHPLSESALWRHNSAIANAERPTLAARDPLRLPSLAELEDQDNQVMDQVLENVQSCPTM